MLYKDKTKHKEANKRAKSRVKLKQAPKSSLGCPTIDEVRAEGIPARYSQADIPSGIPRRVMPAKFWTVAKPEVGEYLGPGI